MSKELAQGLDGKGKKLQSRIWFFSLVEEENDIPKIFDNLKKCSAVNVFTIRHDKDRIRQDDGTSVPKRPHWHFAIRFENPALISTVANIFDFQVENYHFIQKAKNWRASCRYLCHLDQKDKHLYPVEDVQVLRGTKDDWFNVAIGKAQVVTTDADLFPDFGNFDKVPYQQQYIDIYNNLDDVRRRNLLVRELKTTWENYLEKRKFEMTTKKVKVIFVEGKAGSGKSTFAIGLAKNNKKTYCVSSSSNDILQDYTCEDYLILDDLRDDTFTFVDLLKLLDNFVISSVKSRYKNKMFLGEYIVITSAKPLCDWYADTTEDRQQLFRRINMFARCHRNGNSLIADIYVPRQDQRVIDEKGMPNGRILPSPIMDLSEQDIQSVEDCWKALGIDLNEIAKKIAKPILQEMTEQEEIPFD